MSKITPVITVVVAACSVVGHVRSMIAINANETETFYYEIRPELFNWTNGADVDFVYTPSLQNYPDLPPWIHYKFNSKHSHGYLYGTAPMNLLERQIMLDIVGLNKKTYQVVTQVIQLNICFKLGIAKYEIRFKINNLNVEDMFLEERIPYLLDIFRETLWLESKYNLYVTFLASTSDLGQRLPLDPNDTEGVLVNLGSESNFSTTLYDLETEISPLQKMNKCPKDFKRTSVERYFRANGFNLDWCSFKLVELTILNQNHTTIVSDKTSNTEANIFELIESLQYSQSKNADNTFMSLNIVLLICIIIVGIISTIVFTWYMKKKLILYKKKKMEQSE